MKKYISPKMEVFEMAFSKSILQLSDAQTPGIQSSVGASNFFFDDEEELVE